MAIGRPTFCSVKGPNRRAAYVESVKFTSYDPGLSVLGIAEALRRSRPVMIGERSTRYQLPWPEASTVFDGSSSVAGGKPPPPKDTGWHPAPCATRVARPLE